MDFSSSTAAALMSALARAREFEGPAAALRAAGVDLEGADRLAGFSAELEELVGGEATESLRQALALGFLAGQAAHRPLAKTAHNATSFVMDHDLVVQGADGESILRLPWFDEDLFVGRQLPDISEMPTPIRRQCLETYTAGLAGERGEFEFTSYGHTFAVDAVPVRGTDGGTEAVLAIATPARSFASAATAYERTAERLERTAAAAEERAALHSIAGRADDEAAARQAAEKGRIAAERARANAERLHARDRPAGDVEPPSLTSRQTEVLLLASHGLTLSEIADQLAVSTGTVRTHLDNIYPKLGVSDKASAVAAGLRHGLID
jgi:DNA-binding NarL/FixJ family response regulator